MKIAVINSGSSSLKFKLFDMKRKSVIYKKNIENIGEKEAPIQTHTQALESLEIDFKTIDAIGHRIVHGGKYFSKTTQITDKVIKKIEDSIPLAPLHNPANIEGIKIIQQKIKNIPQFAIFDTAFHQTMPKEAYLYALPYKMYEKHTIRRYGFHGISHAYLLKETAKKLNKKTKDVNIITLHLGNGASICAIKNGKSIDTSMGFTPLEGLIMGTRSGNIDPSIIIYMQKELKLTIEEIDIILNKKSGLMGLCQENNVKKIINRTDKQAILALNMMIQRIQKYIASYLVLFEEVDAIVFSGGIGENSKEIREKILEAPLFRKLKLKVFIIKTDEELEIAKECYKILKKN